MLIEDLLLLLEERKLDDTINDEVRIESERKGSPTDEGGVAGLKERNQQVTTNDDEARGLERKGSYDDGGGGGIAHLLELLKTRNDCNRGKCSGELDKKRLLEVGLG